MAYILKGLTNIRNGLVNILKKWMDMLMRVA